MRGKQDKRKLTERRPAASGREGIELVANYKARGFIFFALGFPLTFCCPSS